MNKKAKHPGGRPKEPVSEKVDFHQLGMLCEKGFTDKELAKFYKVSEVTINNWKKDKQFSLVLKDSKLVADERVEKALFDRACGYETQVDKIFQYEGSPVIVPTTEKYPPDPTSMIFWLKNRQPGKWRDKQEVEHSGQVHTIQHTQFNIKPIGKKK